MIGIVFNGCERKQIKFKMTVFFFLILSLYASGCTMAQEISAMVNAREFVSKTSKAVLVRIPAGTFSMGSPIGEKRRVEDEVLHTVNITKAFYLGRNEVSFEQYESVMSGEEKGVRNEWHCR